MATYQTSNRTSYGRFTIEITEGTSDITTNTSAITWALKYTSSGQYYCGVSTFTIVDSQGNTLASYSRSYGKVTNISQGTQTLKSGSTSATHNSDGTGTLTTTITYCIGNRTYYTETFTTTLATIPRASVISLSASTLTLGTTGLTMTATSKANFYHDLTWNLNGSTTTVWTKRQINATSNSSTIGYTTLLGKLSNVTSGTLTATLKTYSLSGSTYTQVGATQTAACSISVNTSTYKPSVTLGTISVNTKTSGNTLSALVAGYCTAKATVTATNSTGATSFSVVVTTSHGSMNAGSFTANGTATTNTLPASSSNYTLTLTATITDSRGVSTTTTKTATVYGYAPPRITGSFYRVVSTSDTSKDEAGLYAYGTYSGVISSSVNNTNSMSSTSATYSGASSGSYSSGATPIALAENGTLTFTVTAKDKVSSNTATFDVGTALIPLDLYDSGTSSTNRTIGAAIGGVAASNKFDVYLPTNLKSSLNVAGSVTFSGATSGVITTEVARPASARQSGTLSPIEQLFITDLSTNKIFGIPAANITAEYSTNGGSSWTNYGNDTARKSLFMDLQDNNFYLGGHSASGTATTSDMLRITINVTDRYAEVSSAYFWITTNGATPYVTLQKSTVGSPTTFTNIFTDMPLAGWSGPNIKYFTATRMGGSGTSNVHSFRFIFKQTAVSANYGSASVSSIRMFGVPTWTAPNNMMKNGHLYAWDTNFGAYFPQIVTAQGFSAEELDIVANTFTDANSVWPTKITHGSMTMGKLGSSSANLPKAATFTILAYRYDATDGWQMAIPVQATPAVYMRMYRAGVWQSWRLIGGDRTNTANVITRTAGATCDYSQMVQEGSVRTLYAKFTYSTSVASGSNIFTGTMGMNFRPNYDVEGFAYYSNRAIGIRISPTSTGANVTVRNASASAVTISDSIYFSLTYVI